MLNSELSKFVLPHERVDDLQRKGLCIIQNATWFSFGIDAVLLSAYCKVKSHHRVLDLGTGTGIVPLLLYGRNKPQKIVGLELQAEVANMAKRSVALNEAKLNLDNLTSQIEIVQGDIKELATLFEKGSFDVITSNPPYFKANGGLKNNTDYKTISRHEVTLNLDDLFKAVYYALKPGGSFYLVHRPDRLVDIVAAARAHRIEPKQLQLVQPKAKQKPNLMLMRFVKYGGHELKFENPLVVYDDSGQYTQELLQIYQEASLTVFEDHFSRQQIRE